MGKGASSISKLAVRWQLDYNGSLSKDSDASGCWRTKLVADGCCTKAPVMVEARSRGTSHLNSGKHELVQKSFEEQA